MIVECPQCVAHEYQDQKYGNKKRVANPVPVKATAKPEYSCTVCNKIISG